MTRIARDTEEGNMWKRWKVDVNDLLNNVGQIECFKKLKCFRNCNLSFPQRKISIFGCMSYENRRIVLNDLMGSDGDFRIDGKMVFNIFLKKGIRFNPDLISSVRKRKKIMGNSEFILQNNPHSMNRERDSSQRNAIITCLECAAESSGDKIPDTGEKHLPYFRKRGVYNFFKEEYKYLNPTTVQCSSKSYYYRTWKWYCKNIKVRRLGRFAKCTICEMLPSSISEALGRRDYNTVSILRQKKLKHNEAISKKRREYTKKGDQARLQPNQFLSIIVDGAYQSAFGLPHFMIKTKDDSLWEAIP